MKYTFNNSRSGAWLSFISPANGNLFTPAYVSSHNARTSLGPYFRSSQRQSHVFGRFVSSIGVVPLHLTAIPNLSYSLTSPLTNAIVTSSSARVLGNGSFSIATVV